MAVLSPGRVSAEAAVKMMDVLVGTVAFHCTICQTGFLPVPQAATKSRVNVPGPYTKSGAGN